MHTLLLPIQELASHEQRKKRKCLSTQKGKARDTGIPVVMSRPVFLMDISEEDSKTNKKNYKVFVEWVPDSGARYSLTLDPALWVKSEFSTKFDANGFLTGGTGDLTSQVVTNIQTLGGLAATLARAGVFDRQSALVEIESAFTDQEVIQLRECKEKPLWPYDKSVETPDGDKSVETPDGSTENFNELSTVLDAIKNRWRSYIPAGVKPEKKYKTLIKRVHYGNEQELACFKMIQSKFKKVPTESVTKSRDDFEDATESFQDKSRSNESIARLKKIVDAVNTTDLTLLVTGLRTEFLSAAETNIINDTELEELDNLLKLGKDYLSTISNGQAYELLDQIVNMDADTLRARRSQELQDRIKRFTADADRFWDEKERESHIEYVSRLFTELHRLTGTTLLAKQIKNLEKFLKKELRRLRSPEGDRYPVEEHVQGKEQLEKLQAEMQTRLNTANQLGALDLLSLNSQIKPISVDTGNIPDCVMTLLEKTAKVADDVKGHIVKRETPDFVDQLNSGELAQKQCDGVDELSEYVIVLRPIISKPLAKIKEAADTQSNAVGDNQ